MMGLIPIPATNFMINFFKKLFTRQTNEVVVKFYNTSNGKYFNIICIKIVK